MNSQNKFFCSDLAWEYGLPLIGTATRGDIWFLLEYGGRWGAKALEETVETIAVNLLVRLLLIHSGIGVYPQ